MDDTSDIQRGQNQLPSEQIKDTILTFDPEEQKTICQAAPWSKDRNYFKYCRISANALFKMVSHAVSGGDIEVMGLMIGKVVDNSIIILDSFSLPVEGTETRVNAHEQAFEYMVRYKEDLSKSRQENVIGWYHSHPGYGCWLSGIDVNTQRDQQTYQDPFLAVVIDPKKTVSSGMVDIGAFRTYPRGTLNQGRTQSHSISSVSMEKSLKSNSKPLSELFDEEITEDDKVSNSLPSSKVDDFGVHRDEYYSLECSFFKTELDAQILEMINTNSDYTLKSDNNEFLTQQINSQLLKTTEALANIQVSKLVMPREENKREFEKRRNSQKQFGSLHLDPRIKIQNEINQLRLVTEELNGLKQFSSIIANDVLSGLLRS